MILRMSRVSTMDGTGATVLRDAIERLEHRGITVLLPGIRPGHTKTLDAIGVLSRLQQQGRVFAHTSDAIVAARAVLHHAGVMKPVTRPALDAA